MLANPDPHYASPPITRAPLLLGLSFALLSVALLFVAARILVKWKLKQLGKEDLFIVMSAVMTLALLLTTHTMTRFGFGMHTKDLRPEWIPTYRKFYFAMGILGGTPSALNKLSMLTFYLRLSPHPTFRTMCHLCIAYTALTYTAISIVNVFGCIPISGAWSSNPDLHAKCISKAGFYYFIAINNIALDMVMLILPIPILLKLRVSVRVKIGLVAMFTMGFLVTGASCYYMYRLYRALGSLDPAWDTSICWIVGVGECNVGMMTACMPGVMVFVRWVRGDQLERGVLGKPGVEGIEPTTIGGGGRGRPYIRGMEVSTEFMLSEIEGERV